MNKYMERFAQEIADIVEVCHRDGELGYGPAVSGNISYRVEEDVVLITPTKTPKRLMRPEDICVVDMQGNALYLPEGKKPTGEVFMHLHFMNARADIKAVFHAHPPLSTGMSTTEAGKKAMMLPLIPEAMMQLGPVLTVPYADPNMKELALACGPYVNDSNGFLLECHGALVCSPNHVLETIESMQILESLAESIQAGLVMGQNLKVLTQKDIEGIDETIQELGWKLPGAPGRYSSIMEMFPSI